MEENHKSEVHVVRFYTSAFKEAVTTDDAWERSPLEIHQKLTRAQGEELAEKYSQAAAVVLQVEGAPIGCITLELPPKCTINLPEDNEERLKHDPRIDALMKAAKLIEKYR